MNQSNNVLMPQYPGSGALPASPQAVPPPTALEVILHQMSDLHVLTNRIERAIGRAYGVSPDSEKNVNGGPAPEALLVRIDMAVTDVRARLERAALSLERIA